MVGQDLNVYKTEFFWRKLMKEKIVDLPVSTGNLLKLQQIHLIFKNGLCEILLVFRSS